MKRFRFSLRPVGVIRAHREMRAREALAAAIQAFSRAEGDLLTARKRVAALAESISSGRNGRFCASEAAAFLGAYRRECALEAEARRGADAAEAAMVKCRDAYIEANRQLKAISKLEERARAAHRLEYLRQDQASLDEIAVSRAARATRLS